MVARQSSSGAAGPTPTSRIFLVVLGLFVMALVVSNVVAVKIVELWGRQFDAGTLLFPLAYVIGDVVTEVYGFRRARLVIWIGFLANVVAVGAIQAAIHLPSAGFWEENQPAFETALGTTWRIFAGSLAAYLVGELANSYVLSRLKVATSGRFLWLRTISSTVVGQGLDSAVFSTIAFAGTGIELGNQIVTIWLVKVVWEVAATPLTYAAVGALKRTEGVDVYDVQTRLDLFSRRRA